MHKKLTALFCVLTLVLAMFAIPVSAAPEFVATVTKAGQEYTVKPTTTTNILWDNFEDGDTSKWYFRNTEGESTRKAEILEENGNRFLRYSLTNANYSDTFSEVDKKHPVLSRSFASDGAIAIDMNGISIFEMDVRTSLSNVEKTVMLNFPYRGETMPDGTPYGRGNADLGGHGWNSRTLLSVRKDTNMLAYSPTSSWVGTAMHYTGSKEVSELSSNEWYKVRYVYNNAATPKTVSVYVYTYNSDGTLSETPVAKSENQEINAWWYFYYDMGSVSNGEILPPKFPIENPQIYDLTLRLYPPNGVTSSASMDVDNIRLFAQKTVVNTSVSTNTDIGILYKPTEVSLSFDAPIDYNEGSISVEDSEGNTVLHTGSYDEAKRTYTATFESELSGGDFKFVLGDTVAPLNASEGKVATVNFASREVPFESYDTMPPSAKNITIDGRVIPDTVLTADYDFSSESGTEEGSVFKWYSSSSGEEGTFTQIDGFNEKTINVTEASLYGKYVMFSVTPKSDNGLVGQEYFSEAVIPEFKPVISDLKLSSATLFPGSYLAPLYNFSDINEDLEKGTIVEWYTSSDGTSNWQKVSEENKYHISEADLGLYLKCKVTPMSNSVCEKQGDTYESEVAGPVADLLATTNMYVDPSFETTKIGEYWRYGARDGVWKGTSITKDDAHTGQYSLRVPPRASVHDSWGQPVDVISGNVYVSGVYAKKANDKMADTGGLWAYISTDTGNTRYDKHESEYEYTVTRRWQLCVGTFLATMSRDMNFNFVSFETMGTMDALFDDMYVGELLVADIETFEHGDVLIPQFGETTLTLTSGKILNQLGTTHGLVDETIQFDLSGAEGVSIKDGNLIITNRAKAGRVNVRLFVEPQYPGADQTVFEKYVTVNLVPNNDPSPKAYDVTASGDVAEGNTLTGSYEFYQIDSKNDASTFAWTYCDTEDGTYAPIPNANALTYTVESTYADKYIKFMVIPKTDDGMVGTAVYSDFLTKARPPVASNVTIDGEFNVGGSITADFDFYDPNGDDEGNSVYRWMIADSTDANFRPISGQTTNTLTLTEDMIGKYIKVGVTPVSQLTSGTTETGIEVWSNSMLGPVPPQVTNVSINNNNGKLEGLYTYSHPHNIKEMGTTFKWTVDGAVVSDKIYYVPDFSGVKTITFTVTPKSLGNPSTGEGVSVSISMNNGGTSTGGFVSGGTGGGGTGGSSGGSGGSGAGSGSGAGVTNINDMNLVDPTKEPEKETATTGSDIDNHWGKIYIEEMAKRGVMVADENGNYNPDVNVTREEMVTYLFDALKLTESEYSGQFTDVADGEFAKKLQTMLNNGTIAKDVNFRPNDTISREEMCKILYVSLKNAGKLADVEDGLINTFADYDGISDWARVYVNAIFGNKIMVGVSDTEFDAKGTVTKAQAATMLVRILALTEVE